MNIDNSELAPRNPINAPSRISIIVAVLNGINTIERCLQSVFQQNYPNVELIVMDGNSTDGTQNILLSLCDKIAYWESSPDNGIYHAWNKAIAHATGEWICFLGSDDCLYDPQVLDKASSHLCTAFTQGYRLAYGQVARTDANGRIVRVLGKPWEKICWQIRHGMPIHLPHPGMMHHRSLFDEYGLFDERYKIAGDYDFILRELKHANKRALFLGFPTVKSGIGGIAEANQLTAFKEVRKIRLKHRLPPSWFWSLAYLRAVIRKFLQNY